MFLLLSVLLSPVLLLVAYLAYAQISYNLWYTRSGCNIPKVKQRPLIGCFEPGEFWQMEMRNLKKYGPIRFEPLFGFPRVVSGDPELCQIILAKSVFQKGDLYQLYARFIGYNIVAMQHGEGFPWKARRKIMDPIFKVGNLRQLCPIFASHSQNFVNRLMADAKAAKGDSLPFAPLVGEVTRQIVSTAGFGYTLQPNSEFHHALNSVFGFFTKPLMLLPFGPELGRLYHAKDFATIDRVLDEVIAAKLAKRKSPEGRPKDEIPDLLDQMLDANEGELLAFRDMKNELLTLYLAGSETTGASLAWAMFEISRRPDVQEKLLDEIESVIGPSDGKNLRSPTPEEVEQMPYLTMVLNETLRRYCPIPFLARKIDEDFEYNGYRFPKGMTIDASPPETHHNEKFWPDPEKFDPERFSREQSEGRHPCAFIAFAAGPRICIGRNFNTLEATIILATIIREIKFTLDPKKESGIMISRSTNIPNEVWVNVTRRVSA